MGVNVGVVGVEGVWGVSVVGVVGEVAGVAGDKGAPWAFASSPLENSSGGGTTPILRSSSRVSLHRSRTTWRTGRVTVYGSTSSSELPCARPCARPCLLAWGRRMQDLGLSLHLGLHL